MKQLQFDKVNHSAIISKEHNSFELQLSVFFDLAIRSMPIRKISTCPQGFLNIIYEIGDKFKFDNIEYVVEFGSDDIDCFLNGLYKVTIKGFRNGHKLKRSIIIKWHRDQNMRDCFRESYIREFVFYRHIVPKISQIQNEFNIIEGLKIKVPNCVLASIEKNKQAIAILGLQEYGFSFHNRFYKKDLDHITLTMKYIGKLHALSFIFANKYPKEFQEVISVMQKDVQYSDPDEVSKFVRCYYDASVSVVSDLAAKQKLKELGPHILSVLDKSTQPVPLYSTFCHGDCWDNNILYNYKGGKPVDVILIDYQLARFASPVTDISYFLYMSTDGDFLSKHYERALDIYYATLSAVLRQCSLDLNNIYPKSVFDEHIRTYSVYGLIEALVSMKIITAPYEEAIKMMEMKYQPSNERLCYSECGDQALFTERVNGLVGDFFSRGYSLDNLLNK